MLTKASLWVASLALLLSWTAAIAQSPAAADTPEAIWQQKVANWRDQREHELTASDGWLSLVGLDWLKPGINTLGSATDNTISIHAPLPDHIGILTVSGSTVQLLAPTGGFPDGLTVDGKPAREGTLSALDAHPSVIVWKNISMAVLPRAGRYALRVKDANAQSRTTFHGLRWFPADLHYAVEAKWTPFPAPHMEKIPTAAGAPLTMPAPGIAEFNLNGKRLRLEPVLEDPHDTTLFFILTDKSNSQSTYAGGRFLRTAFPDHGLDQPGTLVLDFNQLFNPPCAYTPYASCPLAPEINHLPIALEAGEERYAR